MSIIKHDFGELSGGGESTLTYIISESGTYTQTYNLSSGQKVYITNNSQNTTSELSASGDNIEIIMQGHYNQSTGLHEIEFKALADTTVTVTWTLGSAAVVTVTVTISN